MVANEIEISGISSGYGNAMILSDLSLDVRKGESVAILGKNGMGKSPLLKSIMGFLPKKKGSIKIAGYDVTKVRPHSIANHGVAYAAQEQALFTELSVKDNLKIGMPHPNTFEQEFSKIIHLFPVFEKRLNQHAGTLSGGEQKMLLVARCLLLRPDIIMLDEITEGLQPSVISNIARALNWERKTHGTTMLIIEQNISFAVSVSDKYMILKQGRFIDSGSSKSSDAADAIYSHLIV